MNIRKQTAHRLERARLYPVAPVVLDDRLTYLSYKKLRRIDMALDEIRRIRGDIVEFGVALGGAGIILARHLPAGARFLGFNVFAMIPPPTSEKDDDKSKARYETIRSGQSRGIGDDQYYGYRDDFFADVMAAFARHGVAGDCQLIVLVRGLFEDTCPAAAPDQIALVHIDCEWYDLVKYCLVAIADRLSPSGIIVIDDYNDYGGCRTTVDEFIAARDDFQFEAGANPFLRKRAG